MLLEAVVALAIIALVCVGVLAAYGGALRADATAADRLPLASLATERVSALDLDLAALDHVPDSLTHGQFAPPYDAVHWDLIARRVPGMDNLFDIVVRIDDGRAPFVLRTRRYRPALVGATS